MKFKAEFSQGTLYLRPRIEDFNWEIRTAVDCESKFWTVYEVPQCGREPEAMRKFTTMELAVRYAVDTIA